MTLSAPKKWTFILGLVLWLIGLLSPFINTLATDLFHNISVGYVLLMIGGLVLIIGDGFEGF